MEHQLYVTNAGGGAIFIVDMPMSGITTNLRKYYVRNVARPTQMTLKSPTSLIGGSSLYSRSRIRNLNHCNDSGTQYSFK